MLVVADLAAPARCAVLLGRAVLLGGAGLLLGLCGVACGSSPGATAQTPSEPASTTAPVVSAAAADQAPECDIASEIATASRLRELQPLGPIRCQILSRQALTAQALAIVKRDTPKEWIEGQAQSLILLGFAAEDFQIMAAVEALVEDQLAGLYDPTGDILYVAQDLDPDVGKLTVIHEIVHALQDQHFDLGRRMGEAKSSDALAALQILAEGDATSAMIEMPRGGGQIPAAIEQSLGAMGSLLAEMSAGDVPVPAILKRGLLAPYLDGLLAVERLRARGGWAAVDAVWRSSPDSSAALLSADPSAWPSAAQRLPLPASPSWNAQAPSYDDETGEQSLRVMFEEWLSRKAAAEAAQGWRGDRMTVWSGSQGRALFWRMRWASGEDASQAFLALTKGYFKGHGSKPPSAKGAVLTRCEPGLHALALASKGQDVVLAVESQGASPDGCRRVTEWAKASLFL